MNEMKQSKKKRKDKKETKYQKQQQIAYCMRPQHPHSVHSFGTGRVGAGTLIAPFLYRYTSHHPEQWIQNFDQSEHCKTEHIKYRVFYAKYGNFCLHCLQQSFPATSVKQLCISKYACIEKDTASYALALLYNLPINQSATTFYFFYE